MLLLADGSNLMWRAALSKTHTEMSREDGTKTGAVVVFIKTLLAVAEKYEATSGAVVFDGPGKSFRSLLVTAYKNSREHEMPPDTEAQIPWMRKAVDAAGFSMLESGIYEADDVIATLASQTKESVVIVSDDKDLGSLINKRVIQHRPCDGRHGKLSEALNRISIKNKWGVLPSLMSDLLALAGDGVDELKGVDGIGPVYAAKVLNQYGSLEKYALEAADGLGKRWMQRASAMTRASLMATSTRLIRDAVGDWQIKRRPRDWPRQMLMLLQELEAYSLAKSIAKRYRLPYEDRGSSSTKRIFS